MIILLNTLGYYGVFLGLQYQNDLAMSSALDSDMYDKSNTVTLKIAVSLAYMPDQADFQKVKGQFEHDGELFRLVKQRYAKDTLTIVCVRDTEYKEINLALSDYVKTFSDNAADTHPGSKVAANFIKDYLPIAFAINSVTEGWVLQFTHNTHNRNLIPTFSASIVHPPERA